MYELEHELLELCLEAKNKGHDLFFGYRPQIDCIDIDIHKNGWKRDSFPVANFKFKVKDRDAALEAIAYINELLVEAEDAD